MVPQACGLPGGALPWPRERLIVRAMDGRAAERETGAIHLRVDRLEQLFNRIDPFPFRERDLDPDVEEFIVGWARELPANRPLRIVVELAPGIGADEAAVIADAFANFFAYRAEAFGQTLRELFRTGRLSLLVGLVVLGVCVLLAWLLAGRFEDPLGRFVEESLIILGWVANWRPIEIFLYDWWGVVRTRNLDRRIAAADVEVRAEGRPAGR